MGKERDFRVKIIEAQMKDNLIVKSSKIREFIQMGEGEVANRLLGWKYGIKGEVIKGEGRGKGLGFPTANIKPNKTLHPGVGVYAVWVTFDEKQFPGAMNIGYNPTFNGQEISFEVFLLDFDQNIYGEEIEVAFVARIRPDKTFASPDELIAQIEHDVIEARKILGRNRP